MSEPAEQAIDAARLPVMLSTLRIPSFARHRQSFARADRDARRIVRHLAEAGLPRGKSQTAISKALNRASGGHGG